MKKNSVVVGLRERSESGATAVELLTWLRASDPKPWPAGRFRLILLLHHAFEIPLDDLRPLEEWSGWNSSGTLTDEAATALLMPRVARPAGWPGPRRSLAPLVYERPVELYGFTGSHSHLVMRSADDYLWAFRPFAMRVRTRYDRLEVVPALGDARQSIEDFANLPEPHDTSQSYLSLPGGDFIACSSAGPRDSALPPEAYSYHPSGDLRPIELPFRFGPGVWLKRITPDHRMALNPHGSSTMLVFEDVQHFQLANFMRATELVDAGPHGPRRRYRLLGADQDYYVVAAGVSRDPHGFPAGPVLSGVVSRRTPGSGPA